MNGTLYRHKLITITIVIVINIARKRIGNIWNQDSKIIDTLGTFYINIHILKKTLRSRKDPLQRNYYKITTKLITFNIETKL